MLNNSECYFYGLSKSVFLNSEWWYILPIFTILSKQKNIIKALLKKFRKNTRFGFQKAFFQRNILKRGVVL